MRYCILLGVLLVMLMTACTSVEPIKTDPIIPPKNSDPAVTELTNNSATPVTLPANPALTSVTGVTLPNATIPEVESKMTKIMWINPGKVTIANLSPGAQAEWSIRIHNEHDESADYSVYVKTPDYTYKGFETLPKMFYRWITVSHKKLTIAPQSTGEDLITVKMDKADIAPGRNYEIWIGVLDLSQTGMIRTELCSRWFISTQ